MSDTYTMKRSASVLLRFSDGGERWISVHGLDPLNWRRQLDDEWLGTIRPEQIELDKVTKPSHCIDHFGVCSILGAMNFVPHVIEIMQVQDAGEHEP